jgi:hypothetical protein
MPPERGRLTASKQASKQAPFFTPVEKPFVLVSGRWQTSKSVESCTHNSI